MELRQLEHFVAVAEEGHFNRAASRCHIVPSGLSASIRGLEKELGAQLFSRTTREVRLTAAGAALLSQARRTLAAADAAREAVAGVGKLVGGGTLSVALAQPNRVVDPQDLLARFHAAYPTVAISVFRGTARETFDKVATRDVDIGLSYLLARPPTNAFVEPLASGAMVLACSYQHRLAGRSAVSLDEVSDEPFITVPPGSATRTVVDEAFDLAGLHRISQVEVSGLDSFLELIRVGLGVAILPGPDAGGPSSELVRKADVGPESVTLRRAPVCYVPLVDGAPKWSYALVTAPPELRTAAARAFIDVMTNARYDFVDRSELGATAHAASDLRLAEMGPDSGPTR
jgi:DNA-binding transcriptional LysR family regulator